VVQRDEEEARQHYFAFNAAAKIQGEGGYGAQWAGQGAPLARALPAAELIAAIAAEMREA
jgi:nitronate monooxygenase